MHGSERLAQYRAEFIKRNIRSQQELQPSPAPPLPSRHAATMSRSTVFHVHVRACAQSQRPPLFVIKRVAECRCLTVADERVGIEKLRSTIPVRSSIDRSVSSHDEGSVVSLQFCSTYEALRIYNLRVANQHDIQTLASLTHKHRGRRCSLKPIGLRRRPMGYRIVKGFRKHVSF